MDKNKFSKHCTILLVDDDIRSKIFFSEKNKYYIRYDDKKGICINILNKFKDIIDLTDNYYNIEKSDI